MEDPCNKGMNFTENQQSIDILNKLCDQKNTGRFCDVTFIIKNKQYKGHRNVLAASSPYFDTMLKLNSSLNDTLIVPCENVEAFQTLLDYIYTGKVQIIDEIVSDLLHLSNLYTLLKLKEHCAEYMKRNLSCHNCFQYKEQAIKCSCMLLARTAELFITANISEVIHCTEVLEFPKEKLDLLFGKHNYNLTDNQKYWLIVKWISHDPDNRHHFFSELLFNINWKCLDLSEFTESLHSPLFLSNVSSFSSVLESLALSPLNDNETSLRIQEIQDKIKEVRTQGTARELNEKSSLDDIDHTEDNESDINFNDVDIICKEDNSDYCLGIDADFDDAQPSFSQGSEEDYLNQSSIPGFARKEQNGYKGQEKTEQVEVFVFDRTPKRKRKGVPIRIPKVEVNDTVDESAESEAERQGYMKPVVVVLPKKKRGRPPKSYSKRKKQIGKIRRAASQERCPSKRIPTQQEHVNKEENNGTIKDDPGRNDCDSNTSGLVLRKNKCKASALSCEECKFVATTKRKLMKHKQENHRGHVKYTCNVCQFECDWNRDYYGHMKSHFGGPPYACDYENCNYKSNRIQFLLYHRMNHTGQKPFKCDICEQSFRTSNALQTHSRCHTGLKPFKCNECGKCFATKGTLDQHSVTHSDARPYLCDSCGFATKYQSHLISHKRIHTGDVYKCLFPGCGYFTPKRSQLGAHMRTHANIRSHMCTKCGRGFVEKSHLTRHERIHLQEKPFKCDSCDYASTRRDKLKEHTEKHHKDVKPGTKTSYKPRKPRKTALDDATCFPTAPVLTLSTIPDHDRTLSPTSGDMPFSSSLDSKTLVSGIISNDVIGGKVHSNSTSDDRHSPQGLDTVNVYTSIPLNGLELRSLVADNRITAPPAFMIEPSSSSNDIPLVLSTPVQIPLGGLTLLEQTSQSSLQLSTPAVSLSQSSASSVPGDLSNFLGNMFS